MSLGKQKNLIILGAVAAALLVGGVLVADYTDVLPGRTKACDQAKACPSDEACCADKADGECAKKLAGECGDSPAGCEKPAGCCEDAAGGCDKAATGCCAAKAEAATE